MTLYTEITIIFCFPNFAQSRRFDFSPTIVVLKNIIYKYEGKFPEKRTCRNLQKPLNIFSQLKRAGEKNLSLS